ncbi:hypothetical protein P153DRAFT_386659 [Dothidotthia symphoricarpi CBS 119687]|uniref:Uncharacterized protein n=1 Tax=Dothidotthia symphoricarpi CBS 119687 TaxID=1392245 RepID=A0A6A6A9P8_9PLEO|nr:uncharacterized protein P153DRAFT_386659 [Dothidotthia symphoricarpi CBS 119687]KAF2128540.1 hypothetical protein P153DRAFT_386659 [Dothidotthia symphoricarpi CBS 119687]
MRLQQPAVLPTQTLASDFSMSSTTASAVASETSNQGQSLAFKVGLAMIPVVVILCVLSVICIFWRRRRQAFRGLRHPTSYSDPEKELRPQTSCETEPRTSTSKVLNLVAFSTPIQEDAVQQLHQKRTKPNLGRKFALSIASTRPGSRDSIQPDLDSPIDRSSPFRLKRGNTVRQCSLGPAMNASWPMPPETARMKQPTIAGGLRATLFDGENNLTVPKSFISAQQRFQSPKV